MVGSGSVVKPFRHQRINGNSLLSYLDIVCTDSRSQCELQIFHNEDAFASWDNGLSRSAGDFPLICHFH